MRTTSMTSTRCSRPSMKVGLSIFLVLRTRRCISALRNCSSISPWPRTKGSIARYKAQKWVFMSSWRIRLARPSRTTLRMAAENRNQMMSLHSSAKTRRLKNNAERGKWRYKTNSSPNSWDYTNNQWQITAARWVPTFLRRWDSKWRRCSSSSWRSVSKRRSSFR